MPFPLAHPAAVLPLRRYCPRRFNFAALVIGSLSPDAGYCFGPLHLDKFSHRFLAGSFGFCLPVGLLLLVVFYFVRWPVVQRLPARHRRMLEPLCLRPAGPFLMIVISLLLGAWTHILLDSVTHEHGWVVEHLPILQVIVAVDSYQVSVCDMLYGLCTFTGVCYVAMAYLNWLEGAAGTTTWICPGFKRVAALMLAALTLLLSIANHDVSSPLWLVAIGFLTSMLVAVFFVAAGWGLKDTGNRVVGSFQGKAGAQQAPSIFSANSATVGKSNKSRSGNSI
jgi:hypothetical protein